MTTVAALVLWAATASAQDACPSDPNKTDPGFCGCGVPDTDWDGDGVPDSCISAAATIDPSATIGYGAIVGGGVTIGANATVGAGVVIGDGTTIDAGTRIGPKATIGAGVAIGTNGVVGRRALLGDNVQFGTDLVVGRAATIGAGTVGGNAITVGYAATVGQDVLFTSDAIHIANVASIGDRCTLTTGVRVGRAASLGADCSLGANAAIRAGVQAGTSLTVGQGTRIRRGVVLGDSVTIGAFTSVGYDASIGSASIVGDRAVVRASAQLEPNALVPDDAFIDAGTVVPSSVFASCLDILNSAANRGSGVYAINPTGAPGASFDVYCEMDPSLDGGGWTLIANRRADPTNTEVCPGTIARFFDLGCGSVNAIGATDSYALTRLQRTALPRTEMLVVQYLNGVRDDDDAYILDLTGVTADLFPHDTGQDQVNIPVGGVCTLTGTCDTTDVLWTYTGDSWFHNALCNGGPARDPRYSGNYGVCHNGSGPYLASSFAGNRQGYDETKLVGYGSYSGVLYQERIFYR